MELDHFFSLEKKAESGKKLMNVPAPPLPPPPLKEKKIAKESEIPFYKILERVNGGNIIDS